jgi:hypothetical protein
MKTLQILILISFSLFIIACQKDNPTVIEENQQGIVLYEGTFTSAAHDASGVVQVVSVDGKTQIQLTNFTTDAGPDLRFYLSKDLKASSFVEVAPSVKNGTYNIVVTDNVDFEQYPQLLIWCKKFSVLFGSAKLMKK